MVFQPPVTSSYGYAEGTHLESYMWETSGPNRRSFALIQGTKYGDGGSLVYDVPMGPDADAPFYNLLAACELSYNEMDELSARSSR